MKILKCLIIICLLLMTTGCFESKEEKQKRQAYFERAKENTINYIQKKYGFTPKVVSTKCTYENSDMFVTTCTNMILVVAEYDNNSFEVLIDGKDYTDEGYDNYQYEQIRKDIIDLISDDFGKPYKYKILYGYKYKGLIDTYYDGNNLSDIMNNDYLKCVIEYINGTFSEKDKITFAQPKYSMFLRLYIVNYKSLDSYKKVKDHDYNITGSYMEDVFYNNSIYLKDVLILYGREAKYYNFN